MDFNTAYRQLILDQTGVALPLISDSYPTHWNYHEDAGLSPEQISALWTHIKESDFWETLKPYPEGVTALSLIREQRTQGDSIYFVTSRPGQYAKHLTEFWLDAQGYECPTVLIAGDKGPVCKGLGVELFVDDKLENCLEVSAACPDVQVFLLDRPYNRFRGVLWTPHNVTRVTSILDPRIMNGAQIAEAA